MKREKIYNLIDKLYLEVKTEDCPKKGPFLYQQHIFPLEYFWWPVLTGSYI